MTATALLTTLTVAGCRLISDGGLLRVQDSRQALTDDLRQAIRAHKGELLALLAYHDFRARVEAWEERASIMEYDGGLARAEAEWQAYLCVQGAWHAPQ